MRARGSPLPSTPMKMPEKPPPRVLAVIPSAGMGVRMGSRRPKQFLDLGDAPLLVVTLQPFQRSPVVHEINLVVPRDEVDYCRLEVVQRYGLEKVKRVVAGGKRRQDSVRLGLEASEGGGFDLAVIHDGVRPLVGTRLIQEVVEAAAETGAAIAAVPAKDTVKEVSGDMLVTQTRDRARIWLVQTPQAFRYEKILEAHRRAQQEGWGEATDDALLMEKAGIPVRVLEGTEENIKVTTPYDLELARFLLERRAHSA